MSENTINAALRRLGYSQDKMTGHGFRAMAATPLNEMGLWHADAIERQLARCDANAVRRAYTRGDYWDERVRMMQHWSDHLDFLRDGAKVFTGNCSGLTATNFSDCATEARNAPTERPRLGR